MHRVQVRVLSGEEPRPEVIVRQLARLGHEQEGHLAPVRLVHPRVEGVGGGGGVETAGVVGLGRGDGAIEARMTPSRPAAASKTAATAAPIARLTRKRRTLPPSLPGAKNIEPRRRAGWGGGGGGGAGEFLAAGSGARARSVTDRSLSAVPAASWGMARARERRVRDEVTATGG